MFGYLKDPHVVASFQSRCGVVTLSDREESGDKKSDTSGSSAKYVITNKCLFRIFAVSSGLVSEVFLVPFFTVISWNVDAALARRVVLLWVYSMYLGQVGKEVLAWPRPPAPPVVRVERVYESEYGMPSTHAMAAVTISFSMLTLTARTYYSYDNFIYPLTVALLLSALVCVSRLYMGVHTILDVLAGVASATIFLALTLPYIEVLDALHHVPGPPLMLVGVPLGLALSYPSGGEWSGARRDTVMILGTGAGTSLGSWAYHHVLHDHVTLAANHPGTKVILMRTAIGISITLVTRTVLKAGVECARYYCVELLTSRNNTAAVDRTCKVYIESVAKFITYLGIAASAACLVPYTFLMLNIHS